MIVNFFGEDSFAKIRKIYTQGRFWVLVTDRESIKLSKRHHVLAWIMED